MDQQALDSTEVIVHHDGPEFIVRTDFRTEVHDDADAETQTLLFTLSRDADIEAIKQALSIYRRAFQKGVAEGRRAKLAEFRVWLSE